jgi:hypothetical protein
LSTGGRDPDAAEDGVSAYDAINRVLSVTLGEYSPELSAEELEERRWIIDQLRAAAVRRAESSETEEINADLRAWRARIRETTVELEANRRKR